MCVFTAGAMLALKLVGGTFPWSSKSEYLYMMENHNSMLGIQEHPFFIWSLISGFSNCRL
jgi:molybdenum cofactor sulfurtransferase